MPSPDISAYHDVTLYDSEPAEIIAAADEYARVVLPEFTRIPGSVEDAVLQASAWMTAILKGSINRMTAGAVEVLLRLLGVERGTGSQATGTVQITVIDALGHTVPAGTRLGYRDVSDPLNPVLCTFDTVSDLTIAQGATTGTVDFTSTLYETCPDLVAGQVLQLLTPTSFISVVELTQDLMNGTDGESDADYFSRAIATLNSYSTAIVTPHQYDHYILTTYSDVFRVHTQSLVNPSDDTISTWTADTGYVTVYVSKVGGASMTSLARTAIEEDLAERAVAGLNINVENAHLETVPVDVTFTLMAGYNGADVRDAVELALLGYIHPDYWLWDDTIYVNEVISLVDRVEGVDRVVSVELDGVATDYEFTKFGTLPVPDLTVSLT